MPIGMRRHLRSVLALGAGLVLLGAAGAGWAQGDEPVANWNQERLTSYAQELADACAALDDAIAKLPDNLDPANQASWYRAKDDVRMLASASRGLAASLANGEGKEATLPRFKRIELLRNDAAENGRRALIPEAVFAKITPVGTALIKLAPYYR